MAVNRIKINLNLIREYDAIVISDYNEDFFCDSNINVANLEFTIWNNLKHDYKRIIFFENNEKIYFFDRKSLNSCYGDNSNLKQGPLGNLNIFEQSNKIITKNNSKEYLALQKTESKIKKDLSLNEYVGKNEISLKKNYDIIVNSLEHFISENIESLFIFRNPEEFLFENNNSEANNEKSKKYFQSLSVKILKKLLNTRNNKNKFIFIFSDKEEVIKEKFDSHIFRNNELLEKSVYFNQILNPDVEEITNLVNHLRLLNGLKVNWESFEQDIKLISEQDLSLKEIYLKLSKISNISDLNFEINDSKTIKTDKKSDKKNEPYSDSINWIEF